MVTATRQASEIDPRVTRTRQLLMRAFEALLQEKSISSISVQDITERATVNRATFYAHFEDKYSLLDSIVREEFQEMMVHKGLAASAFTLDNLRLLTLGVFEYLKMMHPKCRHANRQFDPLIEGAVQAELYEFLLAWLKQMPVTRGPQRATHETVATVISWAIFGAGIHWGREAAAMSAE